MTFSAIYMPALPPGRTSPSRSGFPTEAAAEEYVVSQMCADCKDERHRALKAEANCDQEGADSTWPACALEWLVTADDLNKWLGSGSVTLTREEATRLYNLIKYFVVGPELRAVIDKLKGAEG